MGDHALLAGTIADAGRSRNYRPTRRTNPSSTAACSTAHATLEFSEKRPGLRITADLVGGLVADAAACAAPERDVLGAVVRYRAVSVLV
jgi:hypothetical protein